MRDRIIRSPCRGIKTFILAATLFLPVGALRAQNFDIRIADEFQKIVPTNASLTKLADGMHFTEGPAWFDANGGYLIFSDIPAKELKKWDATNGLTTFRTNSGGANGNTVDRDGRLITCGHESRKMLITEKDGTIRTLVERYEGGRFNSPNDAVVKSDYSIWFSDPDYGLGKKSAEVPGQYVYRFEPKSGKIAPVIKDCDKPNGLCFSPDEKLLYVADSGQPHDIKVYDVLKNGTVTNRHVFCVIDLGVPDGIRCDAEGRVFSSAGDGVQIFSSRGELIGKILVPETPANVCFGGKDHKTLFITARSSLYSIDLNAKGAR